jgi:hypothetical protein
MKKENQVDYLSIEFRYNIINCRKRRVVIIESVVTPTRIRHLLADILLKKLEVCHNKSSFMHKQNLLFFIDTIFSIYTVTSSGDVYIRS